MNKQITNFADARPTDAVDAVFESFPLTIAQKRIWSLEQIGNYTVFPDQVIGLRLSATVDVETIAEACRALVAQNPSLASRFRRLAGGRIEQYRGASNAVLLPTSTRRCASSIISVRASRPSTSHRPFTATSSRRTSS